MRSEHQSQSGMVVGGIIFFYSKHPLDFLLSHKLFVHYNMKLSAIIFSCVLPTGSAFVVPSTTTPPRDELITTQLSAEVSRREALLASSAAIVGAMMNPNAATATSNTFMSEEIVDEPSQQKREDKIDINGAFVVDYKQLPGMYPHAGE